MAQPAQGERVLGPYQDGDRWRVVGIRDDRRRVCRSYASREDADRAIRKYRRDLARAEERTLKASLNEYELYLRNTKQNKPPSVRESVRRVSALFGADGLARPLRALDPEACQRAYDALRARVSKMGRAMATDTHRNVLGTAKTFLAWCLGRGWIDANPLAKVQGQGKRKRGKAQPTIDEARKWTAKLLEWADEGEAAAVAALMALVMGMRCSEIVERVARDVDDGGKLLHITDSKTEAGKRTLEVPALLQPYLLRQIDGKQPTEYLFPASKRGRRKIGRQPLPLGNGKHAGRDWVRKWVKRGCVAAGVPVVCAHAMRGAHSSLATEAGVTSHVVAASLGHASPTVTMQHYVKKSSQSSAKQRRALKVLAGGRA